MNTKALLLRSSLAPALAVGAVALLLAPARESYGFTTIGGSLSATSQRDFRVRNLFADSAANNNLTPDANFPGWQGADMAIWKGATEWASRPHGTTGAGDPLQPTIGDGDANFDFFFGGAATANGNSNQNIVSVLSNCGGGGTLAYVLSPISDGWTMKFCDEWTWNDGPGTINNNHFDIQSVACHEFGHSLGLGHSSTGSATMFGSIGNGSEAGRSIASDDMAGVQFVYGTVAANKVEITGININAGTVQITGANFSSTGNEVWFTHENATSAGATPQVKATGVSSTGGGTQITVSIPASAGSGDIAVKASGTNARTLSNAWPFDLTGGGGTDPLAITSVTPGTVESLIPGTAETVTIGGTGFDNTIELALDLAVIPTSLYTVVDDTTITLDMPQVGGLGLRTLSISKGPELVFSGITVVAPSGPIVQAGNGESANPVMTDVDIFVAGPVGELEYVVWSTSNLPSVFLPYVQMEIGNTFSDFNLLNTYVIPSKGWISENIPLNPALVVIYIQALTLDQGLPAADSNVSSFLITP